MYIYTYIHTHILTIEGYGLDDPESVAFKEFKDLLVAQRRDGATYSVFFQGGSAPGEARVWRLWWGLCKCTKAKFQKLAQRNQCHIDMSHIDVGNASRWPFQARVLDGLWV